MKNNLFEKFIKYEEIHNLFSIEFEGFKIWEILRTYIYIDIEQAYNNLQPLFPGGDKTKNKIMSLKDIKNSLRIFFIRNKDFIFLNNPRRVKQKNGKYYCIYTDLLIELLGEERCTTFEDPFWSLSPSSNTSHFKPIETQSICFLDFIEYIFRVKKFFYKKISQKYNKLHSIIKNIEINIEKEFNVNLTNIFSVGEDKILYMILTKKIYTKIIKRINPKAIIEFYDVFPSKIVVNKIAKELNIPIIEIQHGIVTEKNPIFLKYYNVKRNYDCIPDYVLSYGEKLLNTKFMPIKKENIFYVGSLFLNQKKQEYKGNKPEKKNILFISQSNLGHFISQSASKLADLLKNDESYHIIYKMHPYEIGTHYECLHKSNITIINNRDKDLYYYQSISIAQVGVYSTGLYEGLLFGLNTFILNHEYGTEEIRDMLKKDDNIHFVSSEEEIKNILGKKTIKKFNVNNYWADVSKRKITNIINKIINKI